MIFLLCIPLYHSRNNRPATLGMIQFRDFEGIFCEGIWALNEGLIGRANLPGRVRSSPGTLGRKEESHPLRPLGIKPAYLIKRFLILG